MNNIAFNTLNAMDLFNESCIDINNGIDKKIVVLHIPHSSTYIPSFAGFVSNKDGFVDSELIENEIQLLTDKYSETIFNVNGIEKIVTPFSRVFCDVERLADEHEPMFKTGRGFFYTHCDNGQLLRNDNDNTKAFIYINYYKYHHEILNNYVEDKLSVHGKALIIDCHTFSDTQLNTDSDKCIDRPDICIGVDDYHTPKELIEFITKFFTDLGYTIKINSPYAGTIVPERFYLKDKNVMSIMIEINRRLVYDIDSLNILNGMITSMFKL